MYHCWLSFHIFDLAIWIIMVNEGGVGWRPKLSLDLSMGFDYGIGFRFINHFLQIFISNFLTCNTLYSIFTNREMIFEQLFFDNFCDNFLLIFTLCFYFLSIALVWKLLLTHLIGLKNTCKLPKYPSAVNCRICLQPTAINSREKPRQLTAKVSIGISSSLF